MFITIETDDSKAEPLKQVLLNITPCPISYLIVVKEGLPENLIAEDGTNATHKLNVQDVKIIDSKATYKQLIYSA